MDPAERDNAHQEGPAVRFEVPRNADVLDPLTAIEHAGRQARAEAIVKDLVDPAEPEAIGFSYHRRRVADETDVILVVEGTDESKVGQAARTLDDCLDADGYYEELLESS